MIKLYSPNSEAELAVIRTILEGDGIPFFVHNDHFGSLKIGPSIDLYNRKTIMVGEEHLERARELLADFISRNSNANDGESIDNEQSYSLLDKIRMSVEALFFMWFIPGKRYRRTDKEVQKPEGNREV